VGAGGAGILGGQSYLIMRNHSMNLDLLTNATVVDDAIRFVSRRSKQNVESSSGNTNEDGKEPYDEDEDQLEEKQEEETGEIRAATTNQVF
jgi:hypothetical protein